MTRFIYNCYIRDGKTINTGEAVLLACLLHTHGQGRDSKDMIDVQKIMRDINVSIKKDRK